MARTSVSERVALPLVAAAAVLAAINWYMQPARWVAWVAVVALLGIMTAIQRRKSARADEGIATAALILVLSLGAALVTKLGGSLGAALGERGTMVVFGLFLMVTGNAIPKDLTPLSARGCDPVRAQAARRIVGWTWALTGLGIAVIWLAAPLTIAPVMTGAIVLTGMAISAAQILRVRTAPRINA